MKEKNINKNKEKGTRHDRNRDNINNYNKNVKQYIRKEEQYRLKKYKFDQK